MTINDLLIKKGYTVYRLSKESGISKSTLFDIFSGKSNIMDCKVRIIAKIAEVFNVSIEELIKLDPIPYNLAFEENLPDFLLDDIKFIKNKKNKNHPLLDCYIDETNSSINVCEVENIITKEQAEYLRNKYVR